MTSNNKKKVITVKGEIEPEKLGITLVHEHLLIDQSAWLNEEPEEPRLREKFKDKVSFNNRGDVVYNAFYYKDNLILSDKKTAIEEVKEFRNAGGSTLVDVTNLGIGRDPYMLYEVSIETGLNIVMGAGYYIESSWKKEEKKRSEEEIAEDIIKDFAEGIGILKIKPGIIGEIGVSNIENPIEVKSLKGSARAQKRIGCAITVHTPTWEEIGHKILDIFEEEGVNLNKVILSHCDPKIYNFEYLNSLAKRGAYIEFDTFGLYLRDTKLEKEKMIPSDNERIRAIIEQIDAGNINNILISQDTCTKIQLTKFGGYGYGHILKNIVPWFIDSGITIDQIRNILIENPKIILSF